MRATLLSTMPTTRRLALACAGLALLIPACSKGSHKQVYPVRGQVLIQGRPAPQAIVTFHPAAGAPDDPRPSAQTDDQGYFTLTSYAGGDGAPEGEYAVTVTCFRSFSQKNASEGDESTRNVLPPRYANPATSQLRATVSAGPNELPPLQVQPR
jgi:hypothetical protein